MYFNWGKIPFSSYNWRQNRIGERRLQRRRSTRFNELVRTVTNYSPSDQIQHLLVSLRMCENRCDSPWCHDNLNMLKTFPAHSRTLVSFAEPGRTTTNQKILGDFCSENPDWLRFTAKKCHQGLSVSDSVTLGLSSTVPVKVNISYSGAFTTALANYTDRDSIVSDQKCNIEIKIAWYYA